MTNFSFFAAEDDLLAFFTFLFETMNIHVYEQFSEYETKLREFQGIEEIRSLPGIGKASSLRYFDIWDTDVMSGLTVRKIEFEPVVAGGHTFRYKAEGAGLMHLFCGGIEEGTRSLIPTRFSHRTPGEARKWGLPEPVRWSCLRSRMRQVRRKICGHMTVATIHDIPILPAARQLVEEGYTLRMGLHSSEEYPVNDIVLL